MTIRYAQSNARLTGAILWIFGLCFLLFVNPNFATAAECSEEKAKEAAQSLHGGNAIGIWVEGDYFVVRLEYPDGTLFDVGVHRWSC